MRPALTPTVKSPKSKLNDPLQFLVCGGIFPLVSASRGRWTPAILDSPIPSSGCSHTHTHTHTNTHTYGVYRVSSLQAGDCSFCSRKFASSAQSSCTRHVSRPAESIDPPCPPLIPSKRVGSLFYSFYSEPDISTSGSTSLEPARRCCPTLPAHLKV
jgi:hypothetical protein